MPRLSRGVAALAVAVLTVFAVPASQADAKTFRWSFQGDVAMMDPYGLLESMTIGFLSNIYEPLIRRAADLTLEPALATEWEATGPNVWRFNLRQGVHFHGGEPFTADDVVFSFERMQKQGSDFVSLAATIDEVIAVDDHTVEIRTSTPDPVLPDKLTIIGMMSRGWAEANDATDPVDIRAGRENFASRHANGTGPFMLVSREPDVRTVLAPNPDWWDDAKHNVTEAIFTPIGSDPTRVAALLSGELDFAYPVPLQDFRRIEASPGLKLLRGPELRTIFLGMDQTRDVLLESSVTDANPFKEKRVRLAMAKAIDEDAIAKKIMRGAATPTGIMVGPGIRGFDPSINDRWETDLKGAKALMAEAGYPDGFTIGMDCPNDRYVNDEAICQAVAAQLAKIGITVNLLAQTKSKYFAKVLSYDTSFYLLGWTPATVDAHDALFNLIMTRGERGQGKFNLGGYSNPDVDALAKSAGSEMDSGARSEHLSEAFALVKEDVGYIPLHQQQLAWGVRDTVTLSQRADNIFELRWVQIQ